METPLLNLKRQYQQLRPELEKALAAVFESQRFIRGPELKELESAVADYHGIAHAVGVASGTDALLLLLEALDLKPGDEVITTPFTFVATAETILRAGATPVFVDIDPATFNLDPNRLEAARTEKTRGVVPVHLFGLAADLDPILAWAEKNRLWFMEDCAQAFGAAYRGRKVGTFGVGGAFSFFPSKNLGGFGDGGLVTTADSRRAETVRILSEHGGRDKYNVVMLGHNSRLDTLQAAVLLVKLRYLDEWNRNRRRLAAGYNRRLAGVGDLRLPAEPEGSYHTYNQYTVRTGQRDRLQKFLAERKVGTAIYYPFALHQQELFRKTARIAGSLEQSEATSREVLSLPIDPLLTEAEQDYVIEQVKEFFG